MANIVEVKQEISVAVGLLWLDGLGALGSVATLRCLKPLNYDHAGTVSR